MKANIEISKHEKKNSRIDYGIILIVLIYWLGVILQLLKII